MRYNVRVFYKGEAMGSAGGVPCHSKEHAEAYVKKAEKREGVTCEIKESASCKLGANQ